MKKLDFAQSFNAFEDEGLKSLLAKNIDLIYEYPDPADTVIIESIANRFQIAKNAIAFGHGSTEIIFNLAQIFGRKKILILRPTFWEYEVASRKIKDAIIKKLELKEKNNFNLTHNNLQKAVKNIDIVYLCNPNSPTSTLMPENLVKLVKNNPKVTFIIDETFLIFREDYQKRSLLKIAPKMENLYVVTSLSKIFHIAGLRTGFLVSNPANIHKYQARSIPYLTNPLNKIAIPYLLQQKNFILKTQKYYSKERIKVYNIYKEQFKNKFKIFRPEGIFLLIKILINKNSDEIVSILDRKGIIVRNGQEIDGLGTKCLRISIKKEKDNLKLIQALKEIV